jgi:hypothetical protein
MRLAWFAGVTVTLGLLVSCGDDAGPPDARRVDAELPGGTITLTWTITDTDGNPITCTAAGASSLTLTLRPRDQPFGVTDVLGCAPGNGKSRELAPDIYTVTVELAGVTAEVNQFDDVVVVSGDTTEIGPASFTVNNKGGFTFQMTASSGGNCNALPGGGGITEVSIALTDGVDTCVPTTFDIAAGASQPAGTYTTDCTTPASFPACIAEDQVVTVAPSLPTGTYKMQITGFVGTEDCWTRNPQFTVPSGGATANLPQQNLTRDTTNAACM